MAGVRLVVQVAHVQPQRLDHGRGLASGVAADERFAGCLLDGEGLRPVRVDGTIPVPSFALRSVGGERGSDPLVSACRGMIHSYASQVVRPGWCPVSADDISEMG